MSLSFEEKKAIFDEYSELTAVPVSLQRINYHFNASVVEKSVVVRYLHPNGNALIYAGYLPEEETNHGYLSVLDADEAEIRRLVEKAISYLKRTKDGYEEGYTEFWSSEKGEVLKLTYENPMWTVSLENDQMEAVFGSRDAAAGYLRDEAFFQE